VYFRGISGLHWSAFILLRRLKLGHISYHVRTLHHGGEQESISKFLIGKQFHVKLRILSIESRIVLNKDWECVNLRRVRTCLWVE